MMMRHRGGGVGHTSTREATDWFLSDRDQLDTASKRVREAKSMESPSPIPNEGSEDEDNQSQDEEEEFEGELEERNRDNVAGEGDKHETVQEIEDEEIDEEMDFGYAVDEEQELEESDEEGLDDNEARDDALGPEDGQEEDDEINSLGFANL